MTSVETPRDSQLPVSNGVDMSEITVLCTDVRMRYASGTVALEDINFAAKNGELVTLVGPSGCGKSTLLRLIAGLMKCTGGSVSTPGIEARSGAIGFVFQDAHLLPWRTVRRNAELLLETTNISKTQRQRRASQALELVGLDGFENAYPRELSGGMKMRVSLARSLALQPQLFLLDEPFGALDEITRHKLNDDLLAIKKRKGFTAVFVTHSVSEAAFLSDRVVVMSARPGRVVREVAVPFGAGRDANLRSNPDFALLCGRISAALEEGM